MCYSCVRAYVRASVSVCVCAVFVRMCVPACALAFSTSRARFCSSRCWARCVFSSSRWALLRRGAFGSASAAAVAADVFGAAGAAAAYD